MLPRTINLESALRALPELDDLAPLRGALVRAAPGAGRADVAALEAQLPALAERARTRVDAVMRHSLEALRALERGDLLEAARGLAAAGEVEEAEGRLDAAEQYYRTALAQGRRARDGAGEALALRRLGRVARERGALPAALRFYRHGHAAALAGRDAQGALEACQGLGNVYVDQGRWAAAREWYLRAIARLADREPSRPLWQLCSNLAVAARRGGDLEGSLEWLDRADDVVAMLGDAGGVLPVQHGRARLHVARGEPARAEAAYRRALAGEGTPAQHAGVLGNLAECLLLQDRTCEAEALAHEMEALAAAHRVVPLLPHAYRALGAAARARGAAGEAAGFYEQALALCRRPGAAPLDLAATQHEYGVLEAERGSARAAVERLEEARAVYERLGARAEVERVEADIAVARRRPAGARAAV